MPVEVVVPVDAALTKAVATPKRPPNRCKDESGKATICNRDLVDWLVAFDAALSKANGQLRAILGLQP